jgi:hypothetical protein
VGKTAGGFVFALMFSCPTDVIQAGVLLDQAKRTEKRQDKNTVQLG